MAEKSRGYIQINITDLWEKYEQICVKIYVEYFKKFHDKKQIFATCSEN